jgi:hypothetical protein
MKDIFRTTMLVSGLSVCLAGIAVWGLTELALDLPRQLHRQSFVDFSFAAGFEAIFLLVCIWWLRAAWLGWFHRSAKAVRWLSAASITALYIFGGVLVRKLYRHPKAYGVLTDLLANASALRRFAWRPLRTFWQSGC